MRGCRQPLSRLRRGPHPRRRLLVALALLVGACGQPGTQDVDAPVADDDAGIDAPACDPERPRTAAPEALVGPQVSAFGLEERVIAAIDSATTSVDVQMYAFTKTNLADRLVAARNRGARVRVILDPSQPNDTVVARLAAGGITAVDAPAGFVNAHAKYLIVDGNRAVILSGNFTSAGLDDQRNYGLDDRDPDDVAALVEVFAADLANRPAVLTCPRLVITPGDSKARILTLIGSAQTSLDLELYYLADTNVRAAVITAKNRGIAVRVLLADVGEIPDNATTANTLKAAGVAVRTLRNPTVHAKAIIVDGAAALVGSNNMSITSFRDNREVGAIVRDAATVNRVKSQLDADWNAATAW